VRKKQFVSFYTKENEIKTAYFSNISMILLIYKETCFNVNELDLCIPSIFV